MSGGGSGEDIFWPGFVDALSNLVLVLLFVVMILAMTVAYVAMQTGVKSAQQVSTVTEEMNKKVKTVMAEKADLQAQLAKMKIELDAALKKAQQTPAMASSAPSGNEKIEESGKVSVSKNNILIKFANESTSFDAAEGEKLKNALQQLQKPQYIMEVPAIAGVSISKRKAFLRLVAVRNAMIAKGIDVKTVQTKIVEYAGAKEDVLSTIIIRGATP